MTTANRFCIEVRVRLPNGDCWTDDVWVHEVPGIVPTIYRPEDSHQSWFSFYMNAQPGMDGLLQDACEWAKGVEL